MKISFRRKTFLGMGVKDWILFAVCVFFAFLCIFPLWLMLSNATRTTTQIQQVGGLRALIPSRYFFSNIDALLNQGFDIWGGVVNSFVIAVSSTLLCVYFSALTAYGFVGYRFRFQKVLFSILLATMLIPGQLGMIGWYQLVVDLRMYDTWVPLILPSVASATTVFFLKQYLEATYSKDLVDAARIDGSREFMTFNRIILPISAPALATMAIFSFVYSWNNYLPPLMILNSESLYTLPLWINLLNANTHEVNYGALYAGLVMTVLPPLIVYLCFSKFIVGGVALGGVKE